MRVFRSAAVLALIAGFAVPASAGTVLYKADLFDGDASTSDTFNGNGNTTVRVTGGPRNVTARAGGFALTDSVVDFVAWCLDIENTLRIPDGGTPYHVTDTPFALTSGAIGGGRLDQIENLFETSFAGLDLTNDAQSAGFQLALWELLYETEGSFDLTGGSFRQNYGSTGANAANDAANGFLAALGGPITQDYRLTFFESGKDHYGRQISQNLVTVSAVPLPAAAGFLIAGLGGLAALRRRQEG